MRNFNVTDLEKNISPLVRSPKSSIKLVKYKDHFNVLEQVTEIERVINWQDRIKHYDENVKEIY